MRERGERAASALSPGCLERNESCPSSLLGVFGSRLLCTVCARCRACAAAIADVPPAVTAPRTVAPSPAPLSLSLCPCLLFTEDPSPFPTLSPRCSAPLPSTRGQRLPREGCSQPGSAESPAADRGTFCGICSGIVPAGESCESCRSHRRVRSSLREVSKDVSLWRFSPCPAERGAVASPGRQESGRGRAGQR